MVRSRQPRLRRLGMCTVLASCPDPSARLMMVLRPEERFGAMWVVRGLYSTKTPSALGLATAWAQLPWPGLRTAHTQTVAVTVSESWRVPPPGWIAHIDPAESGCDGGRGFPWSSRPDTLTHSY